MPHGGVVRTDRDGGLSWARWKRLVAEVDRLGYKGLYCCDHFVPPGEGYVDSVEIMTAFTYLATTSSRLEFGSLVAPVSFRDPVFLARQAMALDDLSGGRMVLGVGAGWMEREHAMFGYELGDKATRMARLAEALEVITLLARNEAPVSFVGFVLYGNRVYLGLGRGGIQRVFAYPPTIWLIVLGLTLLVPRVHGSRVE